MSGSSSGRNLRLILLPAIHLDAIDRTNRRTGQAEPLLRDPRDVAAGRAPALVHARRLLRRVGEIASRVWPDALNQRHRPRGELGTCRRRSHRPHQPDLQRALFKRFHVASADADSRMDQFVRKHIDDTGALGQFWRDEQFSMPIARRLSRPALADRTTSCHRFRPANRYADLCGMV